MPATERRIKEILPPKALAAFIAALISILVIAGLSYRSLVSRSDAADAMNHTKQVEQQVYVVQSDVVNAETGQRGFLLTGRERYLKPFQVAHDQLPGELLTLRLLTLDNAEHQAAVSGLEPLVAAKLAELDSTIVAARAGDHTGALKIVLNDSGQRYTEEIRDRIAAMLANERKLLATRTAEWEATVTSSAYVVFGGVALLLAMFVLIAVLSSRDYRAVAAESWSRRVQVALTEQLQGDVSQQSLGAKILDTLSQSVGAQLGAVFARSSVGMTRVAAHAMPGSSDAPMTIAFGEGLVGEAAKSGRVVHLRDLPASYTKVSSATGEALPREVVILPASVDGQVQAVTELAFVHPIDRVELAALERVSEAIAVAMRTSRDRQQLEELLEETQRQAEELQAQGEELRVSNEELEQQSRALQMSQTQLENQQAELEQINAQLEEQTQSLAHQRDELARAGHELQRSNEYKSQFLANMSHELRTPLNSSLILAKLLGDNREGNLNAEQIKFAQTIYSAGNDLLTLINDILDLSKIEAGMLDVRPEPIVLRRMLDDLRSTFQPIASQKNLELQLVLKPGAPESIDTDPRRLNQIVKNLLSNALKFTEHGGVTLTIEAHGTGIGFAVMDTGIGIPADQQELIFEAFRQVDAASTRKFGGTGLGLSISRDLARLLGGDLSVASSPGKGSTFTLALPLRIEGAIAAPQQVTPPPPRRKTAALATPVPQTVSPFVDDRADVTPSSRALLLVEDDIPFAKVLFDLSHELEFQALVATTAEDGLALARHYLPSAIVLDVGLPDRSGLAVLDSLKRDPKTRHIPVHMVSASDHTQAALEMGAAGYALKPIEREQLVEAIKHLEAKFTQKLRRVLIVEDDPLLRESTARLLGADDVETITAGTTAAALELLRTTTFDCMVLDLALPDRSGLELLEEMAGGEQYGFPPVIVYTGRSLSSDQVHALERFSRSIIIKGARSPERLLDEVTLFLHQVESALPPERQRMLRDARDRESVFEGRRILIAEDDVRNVFALTAVLEPKGATVQIARNGREALDALHANPQVDLVLMDIMMPEMDGLEATRALRKEPQFAKLPIIALTAKAMQDDRDRCIAAGANDYIAKPLDVDKLLSLARVWIRK